MDNFEASLQTEWREYGKMIWANLTPLEKKVDKEIRQTRSIQNYLNRYNCGLSVIVIETDHLTDYGIKEQPSNTTVYKRLTRDEAHGQLRRVEQLIKYFRSEHSKKLPEVE